MYYLQNKHTRFRSLMADGVRNFHESFNHWFLKTAHIGAPNDIKPENWRPYQMSSLSRYKTTGVQRVQMFTVAYSTIGKYISFDFTAVLIRSPSVNFFPCFFFFLLSNRRCCQVPSVAYCIRILDFYHYINVKEKEFCNGFSCNLTSNQANVKSEWDFFFFLPF